MDDVKISPIATRNTETNIQASSRSRRYLDLESLVYLNEKIRAFVDHAIDMANVTETEENEIRAISAYQDAVIGSALEGVRKDLSITNAPNTAHMKLKNPPQNQRNLFVINERK
jgi:hypothetical protein